MAAINPSQREAAVLQALVPDLEAKGYLVLLHPPPSLLPDFFQKYRPDAIALRHDKKLAIEIMVGQGTARARPVDFQSVLSMHPEWELKLIYAAGQALPAEPGLVSRQLLVDAAARLPHVLDQVGPVPGLLMAWSVLEAAARLAMPEALAQPQNSAALLEALGSDGYLTPTEINRLRPLAIVRDQAAHGRLDVVFTVPDMDLLSRAITEIIDSITEIEPAIPV